MKEAIEAYPLQWPAGWKRNSDPSRSRFGKWNSKPSVAQSVANIQHELKLLTGSEDCVISTNLRLKNDGLPYSAQRNPDDKGAAVYFHYNKEQMVIACDTFNKIGCNLYAIGKTIEAMRGIDRWGCSELLNRAFTGFKALPQQGTKTEWHIVLGVGPFANVQQVKEAYKKKLFTAHPDHGGTLKCCRRFRKHTNQHSILTLKTQNHGKKNQTKIRRRHQRRSLRN